MEASKLRGREGEDSLSGPRDRTEGGHVQEGEQKARAGAEAVSQGKKEGVQAAIFQNLLFSM